MAPADFYQFIEGYNKRLIDKHDIARRQAYFMLAPHLSKPMNIGQFYKEYWPLPDDKFEDNSRQKRLQEKLKRLKENGSRATTDTGIS
jgi:hypothetical protein